MICVGDVHKCCGCSACYAICGHNAIVMEKDCLGFSYPKVDISKCVECGLCERVCPFQGRDRKKNKPLIAYAARHKDMQEVDTSRSGAVFIALSDYILENDGVVYGAGYGTHFSVQHKRAINKAERNEFKGSKYAQSDLLPIYASIKEDLRRGRKVLFSGTPCQTSAINEFIPIKLRSNLFLIDIICHGVSSPAVWEDYLSYLERKMGKSILAVDFRDKKQFGWSGLHKESFVFADGVKRVFQYTYYSDLLIRPSCNVCPYANLNRPSDITIGDFWGWEQACPSFNTDDKGCSVVLINSDMGKEIFEQASGYLHLIHVPIEKCIQPNLQHPTSENPLRSHYEFDYKMRGFKYVMYKYGNVGIRYHCTRLIHFLMRQIKKIFK